MRKLLATALCLTFAGCATSPQDATKEFSIKEKEAYQICFASANKLPLEARFVTNPATGRSPYTDTALCYSSQISTIAKMMNYQHATLVDEFGRHFVNLSMASDRGVIDMKTALAINRQTVGLYQKAIKEGDAAISASARRDLAANIAAFAGAMSAVTLEQDRQRRANRPVLCTWTGVYVHNSVVCN